MSDVACQWVFVCVVVILLDLRGGRTQAVSETKLIPSCSEH